MRSTKLWMSATLGAVCLFAAGCGGSQDEHALGVSRQAAAANPHCSADIIDQSAKRVDDVTCAGPWEYQRYAPCYRMGPETSDPVARECGPTGRYDQKTCYPTCRHPDFGVGSRTSLVVNGNKTETCRNVQVCVPVDPPTYLTSGTPASATGKLGRPRVICHYEQYCTTNCDLSNADRTVQSYGAYASQIGVTRNTTACTATLTNVPVWAYGTGPQCGAAYACDDTTRPIYAACRRASAGLEPDQAACGPSLEPTLVYSSPGVTYAQVRNTPDPSLGTSVLRAARSADAKPACTTGDELPMSNADEVGKKFDRLMSSFGGAKWSGTHAADPALDPKIISHVKLLWEFRGEYLNAPRDASWAPGNTIVPFNHVSWYAYVTPAARHACGSYLPDTPEAAPIDVFQGFESTNPYGWGWEVVGSVAASSSAHGGAYSAKVGGAARAELSWVAQTFSVPQSAAGTACGAPGSSCLTFSYLNVCTDPGDFARVRVHTTSDWALFEALHPTCTNNGSWQTVTYNLAPFAGREVSIYFENYEAGAGLASSTLYDDISLPDVPRWIDRRLQLCDRLKEAHVPEATAAYYADLCADTAWSLKALPETYGGKANLKATYTDVIRGLVGKAIPGDADGTLAPASQRVPALRRRLATLQRWHDHVESGFYPDGDVVGRYRDASKLVKTIEGQNLQPAVSRLAQTLDPVGYETQAFTTNRQMLLAAFPDPSTEPSAVPPLTDAPLLPIVTDALRPFANRLGEVDRFHDLTCTFRGNCAGAFTDELSQLHRLLGTLHDPVAFPTALQASNFVATESYGDVFARLGARDASGSLRNHLALQSAVRNALRNAGTYDRSLLEATVWLADENAFILDFASLVRDARRKLDNYSRSGLFLSPASNAFAVGLSNQKQGDIQRAISGFKATLDKTISDYSTKRASLVQDLLAERANMRSQDSVLSRINLQARAIENQSSDLAALRLNAEADEARLSDLGKSFQDAVAKWMNDQAFATYKVDVGSPVPPLTVTGASAVFTGARPSSIETIRIPGWRVQAAAGNVLNIRVDGQWSPTCALSRTNQVNGKALQVKGALTGPQGFEMQFNTDRYEAQAHTTSADTGYYDNYSETRRACVGAKVTYSSPGAAKILTGASAEVYASAEACIGREWGTRENHTTTDSQSAGTDTRNSAAFSYGLRLDNTPFPEYPAGSLLLVKMAPGATSLAKGQLLDVRVLQGMNTVQVEDASGADFYLVPNELAAGCALDASNALTVTTTRLESIGDAALAFAAALGKVTVSLRTAASARLAQGRVLPQDLQQLRDDASNELVTACGSVCNPASMPTAMTGFFNAWVSAHLARLEREVEIRQVERQMESAMLELNGMNVELQNLNGEARLLELLPAWTLQALDADQLRSADDDLMRALVQWVYPVARVRYPETLSLLEQDPFTRTLMDRMQALSWSSPVLDMARSASDFAGQVTAKLTTAITSARTTGNTYPVVVAFPNPNYKPAPGLPTPTYPYKRADEARSRQLWDRISNGVSAIMSKTSPNAFVSFTIRPEDIYDARAGSGQLVCTKAAPIISSMAIHVVRQNATNNSTLNNFETSLPVTSSPRMTFSAAEGPLDMEAANPWGDQIRVTFGTFDQALDYFHAPSGPAATPVLAGLSPVSSFEVNVAKLVGTMPVDPFANATTQAILLVMDVDPRDVELPGVSWVDSCH